jgi:hypothetical protein
MSGIRSITRIEPGQLALVMGVMNALLGILFAILMFCISLLVPKGPASPFGSLGSGFFLILIPIFYGIFGYIGGFIGAFIYNFVANTVGGVKVTISD